MASLAAFDKYYLVNLAAGLVLMAVLAGLALTRPGRAAASTLLAMAARPWAAGLAAMAAVAAAVLVQAATLPVIGGDTATYFVGAASFAAGRGFEAVPWIRSPGSAMLFGPVFLLFGDATTAMQVIYGAAAAGTAILVHPLSRRLGLGPAAAAAGVLVTATSLSFMGRSAVLMSETPIAFLALASLVLLLRWNAEHRPADLYGLAVVFSWLVLLRPENEVLALAGAGVIVFGMWRSGWRRHLVHASLALAVFALPVAVGSHHRYQAYGVWGLQSGNGLVPFSGIITFGRSHGHAFGRADGPMLADIVDTVYASGRLPAQSPDAVLDSGANIVRDIYWQEKGITEEETDDRFARAAFEVFRARPAEVGRLLLQKAYIHVFRDVKVHAFTSVLPGEALAEPPATFNRYTNGRFLAVDALSILDDPPVVWFDHIRTGHSPHAWAIHAVRAWHRASQKWMAASGLFWNHLILAGIVLVGWRGLRQWPFALLALYLALKVAAPIAMGLGDQRYYLPGYPLMVPALFVALQAWWRWSQARVSGGDTRAAPG
ncbi:MAG: hypothetical protein ACM31L_14675 [Actinomycetota bacterium]